MFSHSLERVLHLGPRVVPPTNPSHPPLQVDLWVVPSANSTDPPLQVDILIPESIGQALFGAAEPSAGAVDGHAPALPGANRPEPGVDGTRPQSVVARFRCLDSLGLVKAGRGGLWSHVLKHV